MSSPLRIKLVAEGPTDFIIIEAALTSILGTRSFTLIPLQPEASAAFSLPGEDRGGGWGGVYKWCRQALTRSGQVFTQDLTFIDCDALIIHLDADVADKDYADISIQNPPKDLPCARKCPPAHDTVEALTQVLLGWFGETSKPPKTALCIPSKSTEAWVMAALYSNDAPMTRRGWECFPEPESRLAQQPKAGRIAKRQRDYQDRGARITQSWPDVEAKLPEAARFGGDIRALFP